MRIYGNLINRIAETAKPQIPEVGMGATILMYSDRHAATIIQVSDDKEVIIVQEDKAIRTDKNGMSESQEYVFEPDPNGRKISFSRRKNGAFVESGTPMRNGTIVRIGDRSHYHDFSF